MEPFTFSTLIPQGYKMIPVPLHEGEYGHTLFGTHTIQGGWCPNCDKPLLHLCTLDTRDPRLGLSDLPLGNIPLLYCTRCCISWADGDVNNDGLRRHRAAHARSDAAPPSHPYAGCEFFYHISPDNRIHILVYNMGYEEKYLPYPDFPDAFPGSGLRLIAINDEEFWYCQHANRYWEEHPEECLRADYEAHRAFDDKYGHLNNWTYQLGGEPCFWNAPSPLPCPCCGADMPFIAMIEDNESAGTPDLSGGEGGQITFHFCQTCSIIGAYEIVT